MVMSDTQVKEIKRHLGVVQKRYGATSAKLPKVIQALGMSCRRYAMNFEMNSEKCAPL